MCSRIQRAPWTLPAFVRARDGVRFFRFARASQTLCCDTAVLLFTVGGDVWNEFVVRVQTRQLHQLRSQDPRR